MPRKFRIQVTLYEEFDDKPQQFIHTFDARGQATGDDTSPLFTRFKIGSFVISAFDAIKQNAIEKLVNYMYRNDKNGQSVDRRSD